MSSPKAHVVKREAPKSIIQKMTSGNVEESVRLWASLGKQEGVYSTQTHLTASPDGSLVTIDIETGKMIGCICVSRCNESLAFIGHYAIAKEYQGMGLGLKQWTQAFEYINQVNLNTSLYAVPYMVETYRKAGFIHEYPHKIFICCSEGVNPDIFPASLDNVTVGSVTESNEDIVIDYDEGVVNYRREKLLKLYFREPESVSLAAFDSKNNSVIGYICMKPNVNKKALVGPLYADRHEVAELLLGTAIRKFPAAQTEGLVYQLFEHHEGSMRIAQKLAAKKVQTITLMFTKEIVKADVKRIYNITNNGFEPW